MLIVAAGLGYVECNYATKSIWRSWRVLVRLGFNVNLYKSFSQKCLTGCRF